RRPYRGQQHLLNGMGGWVPMDSEDPEPVVIQDPATMTNEELNAQVERMRYMGYRINEPEPEVGKASVATEPRFNPKNHSVRDVNAYLRTCEDKDEYRNVILAEQAGKARPGILKKHKG